MTGLYPGFHGDVFFKMGESAAKELNSAIRKIFFDIYRMRIRCPRCKCSVALLKPDGRVHCRCTHCRKRLLRVCDVPTLKSLFALATDDEAFYEARAKLIRR